MAKVSYSKMNVKLNIKESSCVWNEEEFTVKNYLPINDKLNLISNVINQVQNEEDNNNNFINYGKLHMFFGLEIVFNYTNITFTEKQKEDFVKLYDSLKSSGLLDTIIGLIPVAEYDSLEKYLYSTIEGIYKFRNSALGILEAVSKDYSDLNFNATEIQQKLSDPENMALLKDVLTKLG